MRGEERTVLWVSESREVVRELPEGVRWLFGRALYRAQLGRRHEIASPMRGRLRGVVEIAGDERGDTYRLYYTLKCPGYVFVLYSHKKKSKERIGIPKHEEDLILRRFKDALDRCKEPREEVP